MANHQYAAFVSAIRRAGSWLPRLESQLPPSRREEYGIRPALWEELAGALTAGLCEWLESGAGDSAPELDRLEKSVPPAVKRFRQNDACLLDFLSFVKSLHATLVLDFLQSAPPPSDSAPLLAGVTRIFQYFSLFENEASTVWLHDETAICQKRLREANLFILHEKRRYFTIFNRMAEPAFIVDSDKRIVEVNQALERFFGLSGRELVGRSCCELIGPKVCGVCGLERALEEETSFSNIEAVLKIKGEMKSVAFAGTFLGDINGEYAGGIVILQDFTARKEAENQLLESEAKYRSLIEHVPDVTWSSDEEGRITFVSPNIEAICGAPADEIIRTGRAGWFARIHADDVDAVVQAFSQLFSANRMLDIRYRLRRRDGAWSWIHDRSGSVFRRDGRRCADGVLSDITRLKSVEEDLERHHFRLAELVDERTAELRLANEKLKEEILERRHVEQELMQLARRLKESNAELEQFAHVASHDLKEPLILITAFSERLLNRYSDELDEKGQEYLVRILKATHQMQDLIDGLLQLSRVTTRGRPFESIELAELVHQVVEHLEERIAQSGGLVTVQSDHVLRGDRMQVWQLFQNIISNALKYRKDDETPVVTVASHALDGHLCEITVTDNGIGFDEQYLERIFVPFVRLHARSKYEGSGMGLATCKKIVTRHGGEITARSTPGKGSTFIIRLPLWHGETGESPAPAELEENTP